MFFSMFMSCHQIMSLFVHMKNILRYLFLFKFNLCVITRNKMSDNKPFDSKIEEYNKTTLPVAEKETLKPMDETPSVKSYARSNRMEDTSDAKCIEKILIFMSYIIVILTFPLSLLFVFVIVRQFERAVILRNGKIYKKENFGPGLIFYLPCVDTVNFVDLRIICYAVEPQEALTKDSLTVTVDAVVYYKICEPIWAVINVANYKSSTQYLAATALRNAIGATKLSELLTNRPAVSQQIFHQMRNFTREWGIQVVRVEIKDISLPLQLQKSMAAEAESSRLANAKIIVAKAEIESTKSLQKATAMLLDNPLTMQLRYLQSLNMIASDQTHTVVVPFCTETLRKIFQR